MFEAHDKAWRTKRVLSGLSSEDQNWMYRGPGLEIKKV